MNLHYRDERTDIGRVYLNDYNFDSRVGSEIFSAHYCRATGLSMRPNMNDNCISPALGDELEKSIYVIKYDDKSFREMHKNFCLDNQITIERFGKSINEICMAAGGTNLLTRIFCFQHTMQEKGARMEAMLNKHSGIYPELFPLEDTKIE